MELSLRLAPHSYHRYPALIPESPFMDDKAPGKVKKVKMVWTYEGPVLFWTAPKAKDEMDKAVQYVVYRFDKKEKVKEFCCPCDRKADESGERSAFVHLDEDI